MSKKKSETLPKEENIVFHNKVSPNYRSLHVDGAYGGITAKGFVNLSFFSERLPIPKSSTYVIHHDSQSVEKLFDSDDTKVGVLREYDFGIYLNLDAAKRVSVLLAQKVEELEAFTKKQEENDRLSK